jgi:hypothetical protein
MTTPPGWRTVDVGDVASLAVPSDAVDRQVQPIDSIVIVLDGGGFELAIEYGLFVGRLGPLDVAEQRDRVVDGRSGRESVITAPGSGPPWPVARVLQLADGPSTLSIRMSCHDESACRQAEQIFSSVRFR